MSFLNGLSEMFRNSALSALGAGFQAMADPQAFLKDDLPPNADPIAKWIQSRNRRACRLHARKEAAGEYSSLGALRRPRYERVCGPYLDSINEGPTSGGSYAPPFTGGQCAGAKYKLIASGQWWLSSNPSVKINWNSTYNCTDPVNNVLGPISSEFGVNFQGNPYWGWKGGNGQLLVVILVGSPEGIITVNSQSVEICSGADNCGNPPNQYKPPQYPPNLPPIGPPDTSTPPPGGDGNDDVQVDDDGNIRVCENGDCSDPFPPGGGNPSEDPGEPDGDPKENDPDDPNDDTIEGCAEEGKILTGLQINFTKIPLAVSGPLDYYRNVCYVGFGPDLNLIDLVIDGKLVKDGQFVIPDSESCRCYRVVVSPGWGLSIQAYSRPEKTE